MSQIRWIIATVLMRVNWTVAEPVAWVVVAIAVVIVAAVEVA